MIQVPIVDRAFPNKVSMQGEMPKHMQWVWNWETPQKLVVFTDRATEAAEPGKFSKADGARKFALLLEARHCDNTGYKTVQRLSHVFERILTHEQEIMEEFTGKALWYPHGGVWIPPADRRLDHTKTDLVSIIASNKAAAVGHKLRHAVITKFRDTLKVYGRQYNPIEFKTEALAPFMFSVTIENGQSDDYFTEKLIDCFMTGCVPIYYGCAGISRYFNMDGILTFNTLDELAAILPTLTPDLYLSMRPAMADNFYRSMPYLCSEDWICEHYPNLFV